MRRLVRTLPWIVAWAAILAACAGIAFFTRASYTDYGADQDALMALPYWHGSYSSEEVDEMRKGLSEHGGDARFLDPETLIDDADAIVECEFTGRRAVSYQAFSSQIHVSRVLKGDGGLAGSTMAVFEPMGIWLPDGFSERRADAAKVKDNNMLGCTMMRPSQPYMLFLEKRAYPEAADRAGKPDEYVVCKSPFAKLDAAPKGEPDPPVAPNAPLSVGESLSYDILARDDSSAQSYCEERDRLLGRLGV